MADDFTMPEVKKVGGLAGEVLAVLRVYDRLAYAAATGRQVTDGIILRAARDDYSDRTYTAGRVALILPRLIERGLVLKTACGGYRVTILGLAAIGSWPEKRGQE